MKRGGGIILLSRMCVRLVWLRLDLGFLRAKSGSTNSGTLIRGNRMISRTETPVLSYTPFLASFNSIGNHPERKRNANICMSLGGTPEQLRINSGLEDQYFIKSRHGDGDLLCMPPPPIFTSTQSRNTKAKNNDNIYSEINSIPSSLSPEGRFTQLFINSKVSPDSLGRSISSKLRESEQLGDISIYPYSASFNGFLTNSPLCRTTTPLKK